MFPIGARLRQLREEKNLSQGHIEARTGLFRCYISRVENGHTAPTLETLERMAHALEVPLHQIFHREGEKAPQSSATLPRSFESLARVRGKAGEDARFLMKIKRCLPKLGDKERALVLDIATKLSTVRADKA